MCADLTSKEAGAIAFEKRKLVVTFNITQGGLGAAREADAVVLEDYRVRCRILETGMEASSTASLRIDGLSLNIINRLSVIHRAPATISDNYVSVAVEDKVMGRVEVFSGGIVSAAADFSTMPEIGFVVEASSSCIAAARPIAATSFKGHVAAADIYRLIAAKSGLMLRDHGVTAQVANPNLPGTAAQQIALLSYAIRSVYHIGRSALDVWPEDAALSDESATLISAETGMIGTPSYSSTGISVRMIFSHQLQFFGKIRVQSPFLPAIGAKITPVRTGEGHVGRAWAPYNGFWRINRILHALDAEMPGGAWFTELNASILHI
ncbi:hypothetical protein N5W20_06800 [Candidatus Kirkpatrickella diaphorinae]|uniref:Uncharacterized protein n=1 Tax=Candidatus Kirkpatrickella diaphorinae TaxID=2984322 RepID=A0ABY6GIX2_9PROT|nr:hypothetical protein [Candidatus Kirkpatrickella diaphorinae]UYH50813.1 hypothetical protein N5W20_06800 [Candidatus Kirkpatrickella diaphorinae]